MNFKKGSIAVMFALLLTGCTSTPSTTQSKEVYEDGEYVVSSLTDKNFTALELYNTMISTSTGENAVFEAVIQKIMDSENPVSKEMELDAQSMGDKIKASYQSYYGDEWETQLVTALSSSGYASVEEYVHSITVSLQYSEFLNEYIQANYEDILNDYIEYMAPRFLSMIKVTVADMEKITDEEQTTLDEVTDLVNSSKDFGETAKDYSKDASASNNGSMGIITNQTNLASTYGEDFQTAALALSAGEFTSEPIKGEDGYYFVKCDSFDKADIEEYIKPLGIDSPLLSYDTYMIYDVYNTYDITYENDDIKNIVEKVVTSQLAARETLRGEE